MTKLLQEPLAPARHTVSPQELTFSSSATLNAQFWIEHFPWRPTAAWAALAGWLAMGLDVPFWLDEWRAIVLVLLLVDPLWGSIWRLAAGREELLPLPAKVTTPPVWLPYLQPGSPAARLFDWNYVRAVTLLFRVGMPTLLLTMVIAAVIDPLAVVLTGTVILVSVLAWLVRRTLQSSAHFLHSVVTIALPALLAIDLFAPVQRDATWTLRLLFFVFWTIHNWGEGRNLRSIADSWSLLLLGIAQLGIMSILIFLQAPLWLALLVLLWLPIWLAIYQGQTLQRFHFLSLMALLLSAWAIGHSS
ncbi:MAG: hypothetical protein KF832_26650 [Caldilineaceae bacterium]|nr:hypothetical protein [Caldilineaceae bacterium]